MTTNVLMCVWVSSSPAPIRSTAWDYYYSTRWHGQSLIIYLKNASQTTFFLYHELYNLFSTQVRCSTGSTSIKANNLARKRATTLAVSMDDGGVRVQPNSTITWGISPGWRFFFLAIRDFDGECSKVAAYIAKDPNMETVWKRWV